ncbi:hypothetical protein [Anaerovorax odorimutans]|uniref:hypothetical protein n=1 Tax=Anaerovorax odorimutans TaxID=109327 RepID=UPI0004255234|nr:hypothetical protein [Anaerovorax odorimutans]
MRTGNLLGTNVINTELWDKAKWKSTVFLSGKDSSPYLGITYQNKEAAIEIFSNWIKKFGHRDIFEEIRIAIIEGDIPNQEYGYSTHISTNFDSFINNELDNYNLSGRINRMTPPKYLKNLQYFKEEFHKFGSYIIIPVHISNTSQIDPLFDYGIEKKELIFKHANELLSNDIDYCCIKQLNKIK